MIATWMVYSMAVGALLAVAALATSRALGLMRLPTRWIWAAALAATVLLSAVGPLRSRAAAPVRLPYAITQTAPDSATPTLPDGIVARFQAWMAEGERALSRATSTAVAGVERRLTPSVDRWLAWSWLAGSALALGLFAAVHLRFWGLRRRWPAARIDGVAVRVSPALGPAVIGAVRPEIVVPAWLLERGAREQTLVIAHEAEHVRARDPLLLGLGWVVAALLPWHPAAWWMLSRLRLAVELDCDLRILRRGVTPRTYGTLLIDLAGHCSGFPAGAPALADSPSHLERRLVAMHPDRSRFSLARGGALGAFAVIAVLAACEARMPTSAEVDRMDVAAAERGATEMHLTSLGDSLTTYTIDGQAATADQAHALPADQIATIQVMKRSEPGALNEIRITTREAARARGGVAAADSAAGAVHLRVRRSAGGHVFADSGSTGVRFRQSEKAFDGLVVIDGVLSDVAALHALGRTAIRSVEVLKGSAAMKAYPQPAARNGVIVVTTNRTATPK